MERSNAYLKRLGLHNLPKLFPAFLISRNGLRRVFSLQTPPSVGKVLFVVLMEHWNIEIYWNANPKRLGLHQFYPAFLIWRNGLCRVFALQTSPSAGKVLFLQVFWRRLRCLSQRIEQNQKNKTGFLGAVSFFGSDFGGLILGFGFWNLVLVSGSWNLWFGFWILGFRFCSLSLILILDFTFHDISPSIKQTQEIVQYLADKR